MNHDTLTIGRYSGPAAGTNTLAVAFITRLQFREHLLHAMMSPFTPDLPPSELPDLWNATLEPLSRIHQTHVLAQPVLEAFSAKIQRRLASTVPPKPIVQLTFEDAIVKMSDMCRDCHAGVNILRLPAIESPANVMVRVFRACWESYYSRC